MIRHNDVVLIYRSWLLMSTIIYNYKKQIQIESNYAKVNSYGITQTKSNSVAPPYGSSQRPVASSREKSHALNRSTEGSYVTYLRKIWSLEWLYCSLPNAKLTFWGQPYDQLSMIVWIQNLLLVVEGQTEYLTVIFYKVNIKSLFDVRR